jgi:succinate dehydrogenase / fumarate reductase cytochrome b subunit
MNLLTRIWRSSLGKKYIMALTGLALFLFVIGHMVGNLQLFVGAEALNRYAHFLQSTPEILWPFRLGMIALVGAHVAAAFALQLQNAGSRPRAYEGNPTPLDASLASRTMVWSGAIIAAFIVYHILQFTVGVEQLGYFHRKTAEGHNDVFYMVVKGFQNPLVSGFYVLSMGLLCFHLSHGVAALFQSVGLKNHVYDKLIARVATVAAWVIFIGNSSMPVAILLGYGKDLVK